MLKSRDRTYDEFCEKEELGGMVTSRIVETGIIQSNHKDSSKTKRVTFERR